MKISRRIVVLIQLALVTLAVSAQSAKPAPKASPSSAPRTSAEEARLAAQAPRPAYPNPNSVLNTASRFIGVPYLSGGVTTAGLDCSGFVYRVFKDTTGTELSRSVAALAGSGRLMSSPLHIADLLFFHTTGSGVKGAPTHVGIYIGRGQFIHAASEGSRTGVKISSLREEYYRDRFLGARRVFQWRPQVLEVKLEDTPVHLVLSSPFASRESIQVLVASEMTGGGPMELHIYHGKKEMMMQRIAPSERNPAEMNLVPDIGEWSVRVTRLLRGRELGRVDFTVEE